MRSSFSMRALGLSVTVAAVLCLGVNIPLEAIDEDAPATQSPGSVPDVNSRSFTLCHDCGDVISRSFTLCHDCGDVISRSFTMAMCETGGCCFNGGQACEQTTPGGCAGVGGVFLGYCQPCPPQEVVRVIEPSGDIFIHVISPPIGCPEGPLPVSVCDPPRDDEFFDGWVTPVDATECQTFGGHECSPAIPAGFFAEDSDPFEGEVCLEGEPLEETPQGLFDGVADTVILRTADPFSDCDLPSAQERAVSARIVALSLKSIDPILVTFDNGQRSELWRVSVDLSEVPSPEGTVRAIKTHCNGGTYTSELLIQPRFTFVKVNDPKEIRVLDTGLLDICPTRLVQDEGVEWVSRIDDGLSLLNDPCSDFHPGVETLDKDLERDCDCNENGLHDRCDIDEMRSFDCNGNALPDECDIAGEQSADCNGDSVPDECLPGDGDCNCDGGTDLVDLIALTECMTGPIGAGIPPQCRCADLDGDEDVDLRDFAVLQVVFGGE